MEHLTSQFGVESISPNAVVLPLYAILMALLIPASVFFMYQIRKHPQLGAGTETTDADASSMPR
jgi:hypothetical protein